MRERARTVADVLVRSPQLHGPDTTVAQARSALLDDHVHMLLLTEGGRLLGTLVRDDLAAPVDPSGPALTHAVTAGRTVSPTMPAEDARILLVALGQRRRAVVDDAGRLVGLLCLKRHRHTFCSDEDVAARTADPHASGRRAATLVNVTGESLR